MIHMERLNLSWLIETLNISLGLINSFLSVKFIVVQRRCWESIMCHGNRDEEEIGCYLGMKQLLSVSQLQQLYQGNCIKAPTVMPVWYVCRNSPWQWKPLISSRRLCSSSSSLPAQRVIWNHKFLLYPQKSIWFCRSLDGLLCCTPCSCSTKSFHKMLTKKKNPPENPADVTMARRVAVTTECQLCHGDRGEGAQKGHEIKQIPLIFYTLRKMIHINTSMPSLEMECLSLH